MMQSCFTSVVCSKIPPNLTRAKDNRLTLRGPISSNNCTCSSAGKIMGLRKRKERYKNGAYLVAVVHSRDNLPEEVSGFSLSQASAFADVVIEFTFTGVFHDDHYLVLIFKHYRIKQCHENLISLFIPCMFIHDISYINVCSKSLFNDLYTRLESV